MPNGAMRNETSFKPGLWGAGLRPLQQRAKTLAHLGLVLQAEQHTADFALVGDVGRGNLQHHREAQFGGKCHCIGLAGGKPFAHHRNSCAGQYPLGLDFVDCLRRRRQCCAG